MRIKRASIERRTSVEGFVFHSLRELARWEELKLLQRADEITELTRQPHFPLVIKRDGVRVPIMIRSKRYHQGKQCSYTADFCYREKGKFVVEEHKGVWTDAARLRVAVAEAIYGFRVVITGTAKVIR